MPVCESLFGFSLALPYTHSTSQLIFCLLPPTPSRLNPSCSPALLGWNFPPSTSSPMSPADSFLLGAVIAPQEESPEHKENGHPFPSSGKYGLQSCSLSGFKLPSKWLLVLTSCQDTSSLATRLFSPVSKEKYGSSESLKNPPSLSIVQSQQDCYETKNLRKLPLPFRSANFCFVNNCNQLPNLKRMFFICIHVRVVILNGK